MSAPANTNGALTLAPVFEGHEIRLQLDDHGEPWFCAKDVCDALGYVNAWKAVGDHVHEDDLTTREVIDSLGRTQRANYVNESGLYALIFGSRLDAARRFKRWVTSEVLPSIRKTGSYTLPQRATEHVKTFTDAAHSLLVLAGVKPGIASAVLLKSIEAKSGLDLEPARRALPADVDLSERLNATKLGEELGLSARTVNQRLAEAGLQIKGGRDRWMLTDLGKRYGEAVPFSSGKHAGNQILWRREVVEKIR